MSAIGVRRVVISVPCFPLGANQITGHWGSFQQVKADTQHDAYLAWFEAGQPTFPNGARVRVVAVFGRPARRDPSNYAGSGSVKWILDALTAAGCWPDDSQQWLEFVGAETVYRRGEWAVEIEITERGDA